ncbi:Uncharacterised protein [BD1-7 clade bacterium]|nr:Uncharacterised protein [BD1-7 clade bacterium]
MVVSNLLELELIANYSDSMRLFCARPATLKRPANQKANNHAINLYGSLTQRIRLLNAPKDFETIVQKPAAKLYRVTTFKQWHCDNI